MNTHASAYALLIVAMFVICGLVRIAEQEYRDQDFSNLLRKYFGFRPLKKLFIALLLVVFCQRGGSKPTNSQSQAESGGVTNTVAIAEPGEDEQYPIGGGTQMPMLEGGEPPRLTGNQYAAGFALLTTAFTNTSPWLAIPSNAVAHAPWTRYGLAEDTFWLPATNWAFVLGTNAVDGVHVSSDGTLSFWWPKGSPRAAQMPDSSGISFLAPLQGWFGIVPPDGKFWSAPTSSNSLLLTWQDALAGRDTNSPVTFQAELFRNGDFTYRYAFTNALSLTNFVVGAQHNGGGDTYALNDTGLLVNGLELHWRAFGILDPGIDDHDDDGLSTYDEVMTYGTDPTMPDTDLDGLSDSNEVAIVSNPLVRCSRGDGIPDGSNPQSLAWSNADGNTNGLPDDWETYWFGTNGTAGASADANGDGFSNLANLLTGTDPAKAPPPGFAVTNGIPVTDIDAWEIAPAFALEMQSGLTNILTRTCQATRTSAWQQFFISSKPRAAGAWSLDGLALSWEGGTNVSGAATASASGDSLRLALSSNLFESLSFRIAPTRTNGLVRSPAPLYLVRWTPLPAFTPGGTVMAATSSNGVPCVAAVLEAGGAPALPFTLDTASRPHIAPPTQDELAERSLYPDPGSEVRPVFTTGQTAGYLTAPYPSEAVLPATSGKASTRVLLYTPTIISGGGITIDRPLGQLSPPFPLDSAGLRSQWRNNAVATDSAGSPGFTVSTGLDSEFLTVKINGIAGNSFTWDGGIVSASRMSLAAAPLASACANGCNGAGVEYSLCNSNGVNQCVERDPDEFTHDDDTTHDDDKIKDDPACECGDPEGSGFGSLKFRIPLGNPGRDRISGFLWFAMENPQAVTPALFNILGDPSVSAATNGNVITVTCSAENGRTLVLEGIDLGVRISVYETGNVYAHKWEIANLPDDTTSVRLVKFDQAGNPVSDETYTRNTYVPWTRSDNLDGSRETLEMSGILGPGVRSCETRTLYDARNSILSKTMVYRDVVGDGDAASARVTEKYTLSGDGATWLSSFSFYWDDNISPNRNGRLRFRCGSAAPWEYHAYDSRGREVLRATQLDGSASPGEVALRGDIQTAAGLLAAVPGIVCAVQTFSYTPDAASGDSGEYSDSREARENTSYVVRSGTATVTAREWHVYTRTHGENGSAVVRTVRAASAAAAFADPANAVSVSAAYAGSEEPTIPVALWGLPLSEESEDGTLLSWEYALVADTLTVTARRGTTANTNGIANVSTYEVETRNAPDGRTLRHETRLYTGGGEGTLLTWEENYYDAKGHLLLTSYSDGTSLANVWDCCRLQASIGRDGKRTDFDFMPGDNHWSAVAERSLGSLPGANGLYPAVVTFTDALGRETNSVRRVYSDLNPANDPAYPDLATRTEYPHGTGGYSVRTDPLGIQAVARRTYGSNSAIDESVSAGVTNRTTQVWGGATTVEKYWDGKWTRETRSATYSAAGCRVETVSTEASDMPGTVQTSQTVYDYLGRVVSVTTPLGVTSNVYDGSSSRLLRVTCTGSPDTLYVHDELGNVTETALDVDSDGQVSYVGTDRISATAARYEQISNAWWRVTSSAVWNETGVDASLTSSVTRVRMTGLGAPAPAWVSASAVLTAQSETLDWRGNVTRSSTYTDAGSAFVWQVTDVPGSTQPAFQKVSGGIPVLTVSASCVTNAVAFDGFARQTALTDGRGNTSHTVYNALGQVAYTENAASNRTSYVYDTLGRRVEAADALTNATHTAYDSEGRVIRTWGASYPVENGYDSQGRMVSMKTFRDENGAGDETRWLYDYATGLLTNKVYADGKGTAYGYTSAGKLASRTWARGVTTEYSYDTVGQLTGIDYSDSTSDATFTYDRLGRMVSAFTSVSTNLLEYSGFDLVAETQNGVTITRSYDNLGRSRGFNMGSAFIAAYGYDTFGRFASVSSSVATASSVANYSYVTGSGLVASMNNSSRFSWSRVYEQNRDLIASVENDFAANPISAYGYANDADGRRTHRIDSGSVTNLFGHNVRAEVVSAVMGTNVCDYAYDGIGNRLFSAVNSVTNTYTANALNQYAGVSGYGSVTPLYDEDGNMTSYGPWSYVWDAENRMASAVSNGVLMVTNVYDHMSRRIIKTVGNTQHTFTYDSWSPILETVSSMNGICTNHYVWGLDLSGSLQGAGGVGGLLVEIKDGVPYCPCYDANGNVTEYIDANGTVVAHREYSAFGETIALTGELANGFTFWWSTKPWCPIAGLSEYEFRKFNPELDRWLNRDPVDKSESMLFSAPLINLYLFVNNDAMDSWDSYGMQKNITPDPSTMAPYSNAKEQYTVWGGRLIEFHNRHCKNEGNMDRANYQNHFNQVLLTDYKMQTAQIRLKVGGDVYDTMARLVSSSDYSKLYGVDLMIELQIKKNKIKDFNWLIWVNFKNVETCDCCSEAKSCGKVRKIPTPKESYKFEYQEVLP